IIVFTGFVLASALTMWLSILQKNNYDISSIYALRALLIFVVFASLYFGLFTKINTLVAMKFTNLTFFGVLFGMGFLTFLGYRLGFLSNFWLGLKINMYSMGTLLWTSITVIMLRKIILGHDKKWLMSL